MERIVRFLQAVCCIALAWTSGYCSYVFFDSADFGINMTSRLPFVISGLACLLLSAFGMRSLLRTGKR